MVALTKDPRRVSGAIEVAGGRSGTASTRGLPCSSADRRPQTVQYFQRGGIVSNLCSTMDADATVRVCAQCSSETSAKKQYQAVVKLYGPGNIIQHRCGCAFAADAASRGNACKHAWAVEMRYHGDEEAGP